MADAVLPDDKRVSRLRDWLRQVLQDQPFELSVASADASFRRYFRVHLSPRTLIAMDAPPEKEDSAAFVKVAGLLCDAGLHAPSVWQMDLQQGFMLLEDLGDRTYLQALDDSNADRLFADAIDALITWQASSRPGLLPLYDEATLQRELALFPEWYLGRHLGVSLSAREQASLAGVFEQITRRVLTQGQVYVHRDYMPRNLMLAQPNPGIIDFQDARFGPISYDLQSLFKDAFISWPQTRIDGWVARYWEQAAGRGLPLPGSLAEFRRDMDWMGVQRHLKVMGIFARIAHRDGKPHYLQDVPRFMSYLRPVLAREAALAPLAAIFDRHLPAPDSTRDPA